jgi:glycosyltransferase involved in cell wall biosynthesis
LAKISIIIPTYNVEQYLHKCMDSVINQTLKDIEIICINDGSPDNSLEILQKYKKLDNRIILIDQKNGGLSYARNIGLKKATAPYILFVDSDDWLENNSCEILYNAIIANDCDLVIAKTNLHNETQDKKKEIIFNKALNSFSENILPNNKCFNIVKFGACNKLYKKSIIDKYLIEFPVGFYFEDAPFLFSYIAVSKNVLYIESKTYNYRINKNSILNSLDKNNIRILDHFRISFVFYEFLNKTNLYNQYEIEFWNIFCEYIWYPILKIKNQYIVFDLAHNFIKDKEIVHLKTKISATNYKLLLYLKNKQYNKIYTQKPNNLIKKIVKIFFNKKIDITKSFKQIKILGISVYKRKKNTKKILFFKIKK